MMRMWLSSPVMSAFTIIQIVSGIQLGQVFPSLMTYRASTGQRFSTARFLRFRNVLNNELDRQQKHVNGTVAAATFPSTLLDVQSSSSSQNNAFFNQANGKTITDAITNVQQLRRVILDEGRELKDVELKLQEKDLKLSELVHHDVIQLIVKRFRTKSVPGHRSRGDRAKLALSIEGGGMRGAVAAGMIAALASLGLLDVFDVVYGSSAGSVAGAYMVSRQLCMEIYTEILTAAQDMFICKKRIVARLALSTVDWVLSILGRPRHMDSTTRVDANAMPGMNISFVLDGILDENTGIRPLDLNTFRANDRKQPLRVASSSIRNGKLVTTCFGSKEFFHSSCGTSLAIQDADGQREGLFACLQASMNVPGAAGPPVPLVLEGNVTVPSFDAFCFEPLPYRSAVQEGASHVMVLRTRPQGFQPKSKPTLYELGIAPLYFRSHGEHAAAEFFERGGQQYIYAEDLFTLEEGRILGISTREKNNSPEKDGILIPPAMVLYGIEQDDDVRRYSTRRDQWKRAHVFPLSVPLGTMELPTLEQDREKVMEAVRGGFAAAFNLLAPAIGLEFGNGTGMDVAKMFFPWTPVDMDTILERQLKVSGYSIRNDQPSQQSIRQRAWNRFVGWTTKPFRRSEIAASTRNMKEGTTHERHQNIITLLSQLPGIQDGRIPWLSLGLYDSFQHSKL